MIKKLIWADDDVSCPHVHSEVGVGVPLTYEGEDEAMMVWFAAGQLMRSKNKLHISE